VYNCDDITSSLDLSKPFLTQVTTSMAPGTSTVYTVEPVRLRGLEETWHQQA